MTPKLCLGKSSDAILLTGFNGFSGCRILYGAVPGVGVYGLYLFAKKSNDAAGLSSW